MLILGWVYTMTRLFEFCDTIFYVLHKRQSRVSLMHVYHHSMVPFVCWLSFKHNGMIPLIRLYLLLNTALHSITYGYFVVTSLVPSLRTVRTLKTMVLRAEMIHFAILGICYLILVVKQSNYPILWLGVTAAQTPIMLFLFYLDNRRNRNMHAIENCVG